MSQGPNPLQECSRSQEVITLCSQTRRDIQNKEATVGFTEFCKAFENAGALLPAGCPDEAGAHAPTDFTGVPLRRVGDTGFGLERGSNGENGRYNLCGIMITEKKDGSEVFGQIRLPQIYFHRAFETTAFDYAVALETCQLECGKDKNCVATNAFRVAKNPSGGIDEYKCRLFHRSNDLSKDKGYTENCIGGSSFGVSVEKACANVAEGIVLRPPQAWAIRQPGTDLDGLVACEPNQF